MSGMSKSCGSGARSYLRPSCTPRSNASASAKTPGRFSAQVRQAATSAAVKARASPGKRSPRRSGPKCVRLKVRLEDGASARPKDDLSVALAPECARPRDSGPCASSTRAALIPLPSLGARRPPPTGHQRVLERDRPDGLSRGTAFSRDRLKIPYQETASRDCLKIPSQGTVPRDPCAARERGRLARDVSKGLAEGPPRGTSTTAVSRDRLEGPCTRAVSRTVPRSRRVSVSMDPPEELSQGTVSRETVSRDCPRSSQDP